MRIGIGRTSIERSVIMFTGAEQRYIVKMDMHLPELVEAYAELTGLHWNTFRMVRTNPATLTTASVI